MKDKNCKKCGCECHCDKQVCPNCPNDVCGECDCKDERK